MRKPKSFPIEDPRLQSIRFNIDPGLKKLVPVFDWIGWPACNLYGESVPIAEDATQGEEGRYLKVSLWISFNSVKKRWDCVISIHDGDDFYRERWLEFTYENWCDQFDCYDSIEIIDREILEQLKANGFS